eukprot:6631322-Alexandrium_andersonii.AAC.1
MCTSLGKALLPISPPSTRTAMACPLMRSFSASAPRVYVSAPVQSLIASRTQSAPCSPRIRTKQRCCATAPMEATRAWRA